MNDSDWYANVWDELYGHWQAKEGINDFTVRLNRIGIPDNTEMSIKNDFPTCKIVENRGKYDFFPMSIDIVFDRVDDKILFCMKYTELIE